MSHAATQIRLSEQTVSDRMDKLIVQISQSANLGVIADQSSIHEMCPLPQIMDRTESKFFCVLDAFG